MEAEGRHDADIGAAHDPTGGARLLGRHPSRCALPAWLSIFSERTCRRACSYPGPNPCVITLAVRTEHVGGMRSEQQAEFGPKFGTEGYAKMRGTAPGGGASALGTAPLRGVGGARGSTRHFGGVRRASAGRAAFSDAKIKSLWTPAQ